MCEGREFTIVIRQSKNRYKIWVLKIINYILCLDKKDKEKKNGSKKDDNKSETKAET